MPTAESVLATFRAKRISVTNPPSESFVTTKWLQSVRASCQCEECGHEWETAFDNIARKNRSSGCPQCAQRQRADNMLREGEAKVDARLGKLGYRRVGPYNGHFGTMRMQCAHGHEFAFAPTNLDDQRCPTCSGTFQHVSLEDAVAAYISDTTWDWTGGEVALTCRSCGTTKEISAARIRSARSAPVEKRSCNCQRYGQRYRDVAAAAGYEVVESYRGMKIPVCLRHTACGHEWNVAPGNFLRGTRCPRCARTGRTSAGQHQLAEYIRSLGVRVEENVTGLDPTVPRSEVDVYLPDHRVAVEFDGVWWHAEGPSRERAGESRPSAQPDAIVARLERLAAVGVTLLRIFSDEWIHEREAVESAIRVAVGLEEQNLDCDNETLWLDRRLASLRHEKALHAAGYTRGEALAPTCQYVHPSASNCRVQFESDKEAIAAGYSRVWDSGYIVYYRNQA